MKESPRQRDGEAGVQLLSPPFNEVLFVVPIVTRFVCIDVRVDSRSWSTHRHCGRHPRNRKGNPATIKKNQNNKRSVPDNWAEDKERIGVFPIAQPNTCTKGRLQSKIASCSADGETGWMCPNDERARRQSQRKYYRTRTNAQALGNSNVINKINSYLEESIRFRGGGVIT